MKQRQLFDKNRHLFITNVGGGDLPDPVIPSEASSGRKGKIDPDLDLHDLMKPLILFGRVIAVIPRGKPIGEPNYSSKLTAIPSIFMGCWSLFKITLLLHSIITIPPKGRHGVIDYILDSLFLVNRCFQLFLFLYFLLSVDKFYKIFDEWMKLSEAGVLSKDPVLKYLPYVSLVGGLIPLTPELWGIVSIINQAMALKSLEQLKFYSFLEAYFDTFMQSYHAFISYNPLIVIVDATLYFLGVMTTLFAPQIIMFLSRSVAFQFKHLLESSCNTTTDDIHNVDMKYKGKKFWRDLVCKYRKLLNIVKTMNNFLSPIVFWWTVLCIYNITIMLFRSLSRTANFENPQNLFFFACAIEVIWLLATLFSATMVNKHALQMLTVLRNCPEEDFYDTEVCRLENQIATSKGIGFSGLGCFVITKPFLLKIFNTIFTMEIVLLQSEPVDPLNSNKPES